jgi:hypothetical protein
MIAQTYHDTAIVNGRKIFFREAGDPAAQTILLRRGLPTSSQMFRDLIPTRFHLIAPPSWCGSTQDTSFSTRTHLRSR